MIKLTSRKSSFNTLQCRPNKSMLLNSCIKLLMERKDRKKKKKRKKKLRKHLNLKLHYLQLQDVLILLVENVCSVSQLERLRLKVSSMSLLSTMCLKSKRNVKDCINLIKNAKIVLCRWTLIIRSRRTVKQAINHTLKECVINVSHQQLFYLDRDIVTLTTFRFETNLNSQNLCPIGKTNTA